jgi:hypothetical protein
MNEERFHEEWLGLVQPTDGLVVSVPVLVDAQCMSRQPPELQRRLVELCQDAGDGDLAFADLGAFLAGILELGPEHLDAHIPDALSLYVPEGGQIVRPTLAVRGADRPIALLWDLGPECVGLPLDKPETKTGPWDYPPSAKLDRLLRHVRIPIGILTNRTVVRLVYAPHGESSGSITFRIADMATVGGRPILDAFVMLLGATRLYRVAPERQLPAILAESRKRQANVTNELAEQVFDALAILLRGFEAAAERDGRQVFDEAAARGDDHLYGGLLTQLLRIVFVLYAEDRGLLPTGHPVYAEHLSVLGLFDELSRDRGLYPDSMSRRFGAYGRLVALFRAIYLGLAHEELRMPPRHGQLFSPHAYPFLEGWRGDPGSAPTEAGARAETRLPTIDDETMLLVLSKLLVLRRQRLSYRALDVEQIGSVYEALMGYHVVRLAAPGACLRPSRTWVTAEEILAEPPGTRARWLQDAVGLSRAQADKLAKSLAGAKDEESALAALREGAVAEAPAGRLVIQPGPERRRTSSHYTPRKLTAPIVEKTLAPLLAAMGADPSSERILSLKVCDPAMGSGAFLVESCRYLADEVVKAWTRERRSERLAGGEDATLVARRLVAQRCLYGVDRNPFAVSLAKLSLWLVTLAKDLPFTFLDHALRCGDSLVGLSFEQITAFHWKPGAQLELVQKELKDTLGEAIVARQEILELAADPSPGAQKVKELLLRDADDALARVRLLGDLVVGAFFSATKDKEREKERERRLSLVLTWLRADGPPPGELVEMQEEIRERIPVFHWMAEYPEVFWVRRPDPLDGDKVGGLAWIDAFVGNPPFAGKNGIAEMGGEAYVDWLKALHQGHGNADYSAHFFRRASDLLGDHGTIGLLATNTIAQGDTRATGLQHLLRQGLVIYDATRSMPWPGEAAVAVSVVHLEKGRLAGLVAQAMLDGQPVKAVSSRLRAGAERADPVPLASNAGLSFQGSIVLGMGFVLTPDERDALVRKDARNAERIFPYIGGEEVNTSPTQAFERYVINFGEMSLEEAERWPDLIAIVREKVKPERERQKDAQGKELWWRFLRPRPELTAALAGRTRCLVTSRHSKHLCFSFQPVDRVFSEATNVFALDTAAAFAVLQSRLHEAWARLLSSSMRTDLRYSVSDCFETFPFPPAAALAALEPIGQTLYDARAAYMVKTQQGLTQTYNLLKDPDCHDPDIEALRALHVDMDRAVLAAYGWSDIAVPPYPMPFPDEVIDRLFALNEERAKDEKVKAQTNPNATRRKPAARAKKSKAESPTLPHTEDPSADDAT